MKLPFPDWCLVVPIKVYAEVDNEDGVSDILIFDGKCNLSEKSRTTLNEKQQVVRLSGRVLCKGDIYPGQQLKGFIDIDGTRKTIHSVRKPRNPDGSVYSTELELM